MKIKNWLMVSHLVVMLLPVVAVYLLYVSLQNYNQEEDLKEYLEFQKLVSDLDSELNDASLYKRVGDERYQQLQKLGNASLRVDLYRYDGVQLFSTMEPEAIFTMQKSQDTLLENLNEMQKKSKNLFI